MVNSSDSTKFTSHVTLAIVVYNQPLVLPRHAPRSPTLTNCSERSYNDVASLARSQLLLLAVRKDEVEGGGGATVHVQLSFGCGVHSPRKMGTNFTKHNCLMLGYAAFIHTSGVVSDRDVLGLYSSK